MADLIAQGKKPQDRFRRQLPLGRRIILGRASGSWSVGWDERISRRHVELLWQDGKLTVQKMESAKNPLFQRGHQVEFCQLKPGESFVIGETTFSLTDESVDISLDAPSPMTEQSYSAEYLEGVRYKNTDHRIEALSHLSEIISSARNDQELFVRLVNVLLLGVPSAKAAAILSAKAEGTELLIETLHWDRRKLTGEPFSPSQKLIKQAADRGETVLHIWNDQNPRRSVKERVHQETAQQYTLAEDNDWALLVRFLERFVGGGTFNRGQFFNKCCWFRFK